MLKVYRPTMDLTKLEESDRSIVEILTCQDRTRLDRLYELSLFKRKETEIFGVNHGDRLPPMRGFQDNGIAYEIDSNNELLLLQPKGVCLIYDCDKIPFSNHFIFDGTKEDIIREFLKAGYVLIDY